MPLHIRPFSVDDQGAVIALWENCRLVRPQNNPEMDIRAKMQFQPDLFFVALLEERIVGTVMAGYEGHRGWINYLAVAPEYQRRGIGRSLMRTAQAALLSLGCPKINLQVRRSNEAVLAFYQALGFKEDDVVSLGKKL